MITIQDAQGLVGKWCSFAAGGSYLGGRVDQVTDTGEIVVHYGYSLPIWAITRVALLCRRCNEQACASDLVANVDQGSWDCPRCREKLFFPDWQPPQVFPLPQSVSDYIEQLQKQVLHWKRQAQQDQQVWHRTIVDVMDRYDWSVVASDGSLVEAKDLADTVVAQLYEE